MINKNLKFLIFMSIAACSINASGEVKTPRQDDVEFASLLDRAEKIQAGESKNNIRSSRIKTALLALVGGFGLCVALFIGNKVRKTRSAARAAADRVEADRARAVEEEAAVREVVRPAEEAARAAADRVAVAARAAAARREAADEIHLPPSPEATRAAMARVSAARADFDIACADIIETAREEGVAREGIVAREREAAVAREREAAVAREAAEARAEPALGIYDQLMRGLSFFGNIG